MIWIAASVYPIVRAIVSAPFGAKTSDIAMLAMLSVALGLLGILGVTGAVGLWLLTRWGRNLTVGMQVLSIIVGVIMLTSSLSKEVQRANLAGLLILMGLLIIAFAITIIVYLLRSEMDVWFQER